MTRKLPASHRAGFTLAEIAIVLVIIAIVSVGAISALRIQTQSARLAEARQQLIEAREALINFAAVNPDQRLPCPDTSGPDGAGYGTSGACATGVTHGWLPWRDLALPEKDPWGNPLRYAVHSNFALTSKKITLTTSSDLCVMQRQANGALLSLANGSSVTFVVWSSGPDGQDGTPDPADKKNVIVEGANSDDIALWISRFVLIGRMLEAGQSLDHGGNATFNDNCN